MATINGVTFNMQNLRPVVVHRNEITEQPGSDTNFITDMGYDGLVLRLEGFEKTLATYDSVISEFMKSGEQTLVHRTGWQFKVYSAQLTPELIAGFADNYFPYDLILYTSTPYRESTTETTRSKTITANNQEWSADDSADDIDTDGSVDAVPDIKVTSTLITMDVKTTYNPPGYLPSGLEWDGSNMWSCDQTLAKIYKHNSDLSVNTTYNSPGSAPNGLAWDGSNMWSCDAVNGNIYKHNSDMTVNATYGAPATTPSGLAWDGSRMWSCDHISNNIYKHNLDMTVNATHSAPSTNPAGLTWDGNNLWSADFTSDKIYMHNTDMTISLEYSAGGGNTLGLAWDGSNIWSCDAIIIKICKHYNNDDKIIDVVVYNTADSTVKCNISNDLLADAMHRINVDGTGTIDYNDNFTSPKWVSDSTHSGVTRDDTNDELDIADDGYIYWLIDTKGPVTGIPTLTAQINITTGTPTIQISTDGSTWYDITTAIVDDVNTVYELDSA